MTAIFKYSGGIADADVILVDPKTGYAFFPQPGDAKKRLLPVFLIEEDTRNFEKDRAMDEKEDTDEKMYWMPDKLCKLCYTCEQPFTMYRRRHHCRLCGQVFCNGCSNFFVDGRSLGFQGTVRSCRLCHEQFNKGEIVVARGKAHVNELESFERYTMAQDANPNKTSSVMFPYNASQGGANSIVRTLASDAHNVNAESDDLGSTSASDSNKNQTMINEGIDYASVIANSPLEEGYDEHVRLLESRASNHLDNIVLRLVNTADVIEENARTIWRKIIVDLVREVVATVDPDVKNGDNIDIRPYVKIKSIAGGSLDGNRYIDGVVFHKNVAHKRMKQSIMHPRILLLAGGIEYQRTDSWLSSLDTLLEQEDKYMQILVDKIMTLRPDIVLVGKAVSRKAQELLFKHNVVVIQHIKKHLLQRIARMTGARILPSTDHMIHQHGDVALGRCRRFYVKSIANEEDEEDLQSDTFTSGDETMPNRRVPGARKRAKQNTFAYLEGCRTELGCTLVLRGASRAVLKEVKRIIRFCVMVAYHLRLEVAYINDRYGLLPATQPVDDTYDFEDGELSATESELDDTSDYEDEKSDTISLSAPSASVSASPTKSVRSVTSHHSVRPSGKKGGLKSTVATGGARWRLDLSSSLDVDIGMPYKNELRGLKIGKRTVNEMDSPYDHQSLLVTTILMTNIRTQRPPGAEVQGIRFYSAQDMALGSFLVDSWFQLGPKSSLGATSSKTMINHTLCFVHRTGRLDISLHQIEGRPSAIPVLPNPYHTPIMMWSYCKVCQKTATPAVAMSEETWKMSFGKFLETTFYNRTLRCRTPMCKHLIRDNHVLFFGVDNLAARFEFVPIHPYSVHIRKVLPFDEGFYHRESAKLLTVNLQLSNQIFEAFNAKIAQLERDAKEWLSRKHEALQVVLIELHTLSQEVSNSTRTLTQQLTGAVDRLQTTAKDSHLLQDYSKERIDEKTGENDIEAAVQTDAIEVSELSFIRYPMNLRKVLYIKCTAWNERLESMGKYMDGLHQADSAVQAPAFHLLNQKQLSHLSVSLEADESDDDDHRHSEHPKITANTFSSPTRAMDATGDADDEFLMGTPVTSPTKQPAAAQAGSVQDTPSHYDYPELQKQASSQSESDTQTLTPSVENSTVESGTDQRHGNVHKKQKGFTSALRAFMMGSERVDDNPHKVPLGELAEGRPGLPLGRNNVVILVYEDQPASIIAHSLASEYYSDRYAELLRAEGGNAAYDSEVSLFDIVKHAQHYLPEPSLSTFQQPLSDGPLKNMSSRSTEGFSEAEDSQLQPQSKSNTPLVLTAPPTERSPRSTKHALSTGSTPTSSTHTDQQRREQEFMEDYSLLDPNDEEMRAPRVMGIRERMFRGTQPLMEEMHDSAQEVEAEPLGMIGEMARTLIAQHEKVYLERQMVSPDKKPIKHRFVDFDEKGNSCVFKCQAYYPTQFGALRQVFLKEEDDEGYIRSLSMSAKWNAQGGKSGATFSKTLDGRFVVKQITRTELQMFLEFAPSYFEYMAKTLFHNLPTVLCKIVGVYQIGFNNRMGKKTMDQVVVMENLFHKRSITKTFDLKGSSRARYVELVEKISTSYDFDAQPVKSDDSNTTSRQHIPVTPQVLLDDNLMELTKGRPFPLKHGAKVFTYKAVLNDTTFLSIINVVDYSILVGFDENSHEVVMGIIDYMRQYDIIKKMERMGKSVGMIAGQAEPTVIQPLQYRKRFRAAMDRYLMTVPDKWTTFS